jgi:predicted O-linked N-acetylglucosamine transferase (SPINDLY family)
LGVAQSALGRDADAIEPLQRAARIAPSDAAVHGNLAQALAAVKRGAEAEASFRRALSLDPQLANAWSGLGQLLVDAGRVAEAIPCLQRSVSLRPQSAAFWNRLGNALRKAARHADARAAYERAIALKQDVPDTYSNLGLLLADMGEMAAAEEQLRRAVVLAPDRADARASLGLFLLTNAGRLADACECYEAALQREPGALAIRSNHLFALNYVPGVTAKRMKEEAQAFGREASAQARGPLRSARPGKAASQTLRVGFVSGDLRTHPVGYFLESVLEHWPTDRVELFAYAAHPVEDETSARMRPKFSRWTQIANMGDADAARLIANDAIDLLVDLSGHTSHNRLPLFAWRPAPVQATWLGYFGTTGVEQMDWLVADPVSVAPHEDAGFTERIWRLPHTRLCFTAPADAPAVSPLPALQSGRVTFANFQALAKLNDTVFAVWSRVLAAVPHSRLRIQNAQLGDAQSQQALRERLATQGIDPARVTLLGRQPRAAYLAAHAEVDVILDTFPYPGGTTTCEALWMGVPTVTLSGDTMIGRQGQSLLSAAGLADWVARDASDYVARAVAAASDLTALASLRASMRERVASSPLFDAKTFAQDLANAFIGMARGG